MFQIIFIFLCYTALLALGKVVFVLFVGGYTFSETMQVMWHGLPMDMSMAGYLTVIPAIAAICMQWTYRRGNNAPSWSLRPQRSKAKPSRATSILQGIVNVYFWISSILVALAIALNAALYPYWKFPLDSTPLFYFFSSPRSAMASAEFWQLCIFIVVIALMVWLCQKALSVCFNLGKGFLIARQKWLNTTLMVFVTALLFIPIRGGVTVSTMNPSRAYFSTDLRLNHAAMDPLFSLMYSLQHSSDFDSQFRFFEPKEAKKILDSIALEPAEWESPVPFKPHVQLIILESFSSHLMPSLGGEPIATRLDSIAREGLLFSDIYSSSFRTDRALPAILNGYPAQPTGSIMKFVDKLDSLPAIASSLIPLGYATKYIYGGDANFTNMNALLAAGGFQEIISDKDFPLSQKLSKWGAHDDVVFARALADWKAKDAGPQFIVIQTSSSHEPYEVPFRSRHQSPKANAFAYADSCLGAYMQGLRQTAAYDSTLVFIIPDHYGSYPELEDHRQRHRVPLVVSGGAAKYLQADSALLARTGAQTDVAATILALAGVDPSEFAFSHNLLNPNRPSVAFFSEPSWIAAVDGDRMAEIEVATLQPVAGSDSLLIRQLKAYYQTLYDDISRR